MKKLLIILVLSNGLLLGSENNRTFTKDTCNRTYFGKILSTDEKRKECPECRDFISRWELYDNIAKQYIAHVAYNPSECWISYLSVNKDYIKQGIGTELAMKAIDDMRANHGCGDISLISSTDAVPFWEKLGAKSNHDFSYVFPDPSQKGS